MKIINYSIIKGFDIDKCYKRVNKVFKSKKDKKIKDWLIKLYGHFERKEWKEFIKQYDAAPECEKMECSYLEFVDVEIYEAINDIWLYGSKNIKFWD